MITVLFATYNGAGTLPLMLESLTKVKAPSGGWKLVVIDNASTDSSSEILNTYLGKLPLTVISESQQGKNVALNTGLKAIEGDLVVFTDDDIIVDEMWLCELIKASDENPSFDIFSGMICPFWAEEPEKWVLEWVDHQIVYALTPSELSKGKVSSSMVWGANMMVRSSIFKQGYKFDESIGPDGTEKYKMGSETSFTGKLENAGFSCFYNPKATVQHIITPRELNYSWVLNRAIRTGRATLGVPSPSTHRIFGVPRYLYRQYYTNLFNLYLSYCGFNKKNVFMCHWRLNVTKGAMMEAKSSRLVSSAMND
jgi:glycosyltransferase involved in cell wall biosynthesis